MSADTHLEAIVTPRPLDGALGSLIESSQEGIKAFGSGVSIEEAMYIWAHCHKNCAKSLLLVLTTTDSTIDSQRIVDWGHFERPTIYLVNGTRSIQTSRRDWSRYRRAYKASRRKAAVVKQEMDKTPSFPSTIGEPLCRYHAFEDVITLADVFRMLNLHRSANTDASGLSTAVLSTLQHMDIASRDLQVALNRLIRNNREVSRTERAMRVAGFECGIIQKTYEIRYKKEAKAGTDELHIYEA